MRDTPEYTYCCDVCGLDHPTDVHANVFDPMPCTVCGRPSTLSSAEHDGTEPPLCERDACHAEMAKMISESR